MDNKVFNKQTNSITYNNVIFNLNIGNILTQTTIAPRIVGDCVQEYLEDNLVNCIPNNILSYFNNDFTRRSMEDFAITDIDNNYYAIDCKTHNIDTHFNMPNLISVKRLANFYRNFSNYFCILMISYSQIQQNSQIVYLFQ